jgi:4-hydroxythreonine-4-phosphate dehydrogenase
MKRILVSAGEISGINLLLLTKTAKKKKNICFDLITDIKPTEKICRFFNAEIPKNVNLIQTSVRDLNISPGQMSDDSAKLAFASLKESVDLIMKRRDYYLGLLTLPVNKNQINKIHKGFIGHTEYLAFREKKKTAMLLYSKKITVVPLTTHVAISDIESMINYKNLYAQFLAVHEFYKKRLKRTPKFAVLCLNPHCSDKGLLGKADEKILKITERLKKDFDVSSPLCADSAFTPENLKRYDVFFGMYHDQVLIPFKMLSFNSGINVTCGLSFLRVSPDHGPACDKVFSKDIDSGSMEECVRFIENIEN